MVHCGCANIMLSCRSLNQEELLLHKVVSAFTIPGNKGSNFCPWIFTHNHIDFFSGYLRAGLALKSCNPHMGDTPISWQSYRFCPATQNLSSEEHK